MDILKFVENRSNIETRISGKSLQDVFRDSLLAMAIVQNKSIFEISDIKSVDSRGIKIPKANVSDVMVIESIDLTTLLIDFLNSVLAVSDNNQAVFFNVEFEEFSDIKVEAKVSGARVNDFEGNIKQVTCDMANIEKIGDHWEISLVFDI